MTTDTILPVHRSDMQILPPDGDGPGTPLAELERAVRLAMPSARDPKMVAVVIRNMLRRRGFDVEQRA